MAIIMTHHMSVMMIQYDESHGAVALLMRTGGGNCHEVVTSVLMPVPAPRNMCSQHNRQRKITPVPTIKRSRRRSASVAVMLVILALSGSRALYHAVVVQVDMGKLRVTVFK
jgi:hypothetical protein